MAFIALTETSGLAAFGCLVIAFSNGFSSIFQAHLRENGPSRDFDVATRKSQGFPGLFPHRDGAVFAILRGIEHKFAIRLRKIGTCEASQAAGPCLRMRKHVLKSAVIMICASIRRLARFMCYGSYMKVLELMNPKAITVGPKTPLREVLQLMLRYQLNDILVVDSEETLAGIVTYSDLSRKLLPTQKELMEHEEYLTAPQSMEDRFRDFINVPVDEIMTKKVITASPNLEALEAGATMTARRIKQLPVVQNHKVVGVISHQDIGWGLMLRYAECMKG
ncbi:MAG: CBS domain-containing protein [Verrucomicrobiota bacterium]